MPYVGWVCRWFSPLLREVFLCVLRFSPLLKKPTLPNSNSIWNILTYFNEFSRTPKCFMGKQITLFFITILQFTIWSWKFNISQKFIWVQSDFCAYNLPKKVNLWSFGINVTLKNWMWNKAWAIWRIWLWTDPLFGKTFK